MSNDLFQQVDEIMMEMDGFDATPGSVRQVFCDSTNQKANIENVVRKFAAMIAMMRWLKDDLDGDDCDEERASESKVEHTPGPWHVEDGPLSVSEINTNWLSVMGGDCHGFALATVSGGHGDLPEVTEANARLVAASPLLLEALKGLYDAIDSCVDLTPELMLKARDAITTATQRNQ